MTIQNTTAAIEAAVAAGASAVSLDRYEEETVSLREAFILAMTLSDKVDETNTIVLYRMFGGFAQATRLDLDRQREDFEATELADRILARLLAA
jgi:hypothetical protein